MEKIFEAFRLHFSPTVSKQFLAIPSPDGRNVSILDDEGNNYGGYHSVARFKELYKKSSDEKRRGGSLDYRVPLGKAQLRLWLK